MGTPRVDRAAQLAAQLRGAGIEATHDPAAAVNLAPCVLVGPPRLTFDLLDGGASEAWRLVAIAATTVQLDAWTQLDELIDQLADPAADLAIETAEPTSWAPNPGADPVPAYVLTLTD